MNFIQLYKKYTGKLTEIVWPFKRKALQEMIQRNQVDLVEAH